MVDQIIRPADLPNRANPVASEKIPVDNGVTVGGATIQSIVESGRPAASRSEAEEGVDSVKAMTPLTTDQKIEYEIGRSLASKAQGDKADSAIQEIVAGNNVSVDNSDPQRPVISSSGATGYKTVSDMLASMEGPRGVGEIWEAQGFRYEEISSSDPAFHVETAGGVRLKVLPLGDDSFNLLQFGLDASGPISLQLPTEVAAGRKIVIQAGDWSVKNADLTGAWLEFSEGAKFVSVLGADDNGINTSGGTRITGRPHFVVSNTAMPAQGGKGAVIAMGTYVTDGEVYDGLEIHNPIFECLNTSAMGLAMSIIGRSEGVRIVGEAVMRGRFAGGFQAHWGGDFDGGDPHESLVSASYHPNNIRIDTMILERGGPSNLGGHLGLSLSAAYDVEVKTLINRGWDRTDWIQPGDVYDLVAAPDQKDKIMSGIRVLFTEIINPVANTSSYNNILVSGISATVRVAGQTQSVHAADRNNMSVDHGEIRVVSLDGHDYTTNPVVRMIAAKDSRMAVAFDGFSVTVASALFQAIGCTDCYTRLEGRDASRLCQGHNNIRHTYDFDYQARTVFPHTGASHRVAVLGTASGTATLGADAAKGAMTVTVSAWSGVGSEYWPKGSRLYLPDGSFLTLSQSQLVGTGVTTLLVDPLKSAITTGTVLRRTGTEVDSVVDGSIVGAYIAVQLTNTDGISLPVHIRKSAKHDVTMTGDINRRTLANGVYDQCGQLDDGSLLVNINLGTFTENFTARGGEFEPSGNPLVSSNVYGRVNNANPGLMVTDCDLNSLSHPVNYLWPTDANVLNAGPPQVFGNRRNGAMSVAGHDFDPAQGATAYIGGVYHIYRNTLSGAGNWPAGSKWINLQAASGQPKGYMRTTAGTWLTEGNL